jgi:hypothetical protein
MSGLKLFAIIARLNQFFKMAKDNSTIAGAELCAERLPATLESERAFDFPISVLAMTHQEYHNLGQRRIANDRRRSQPS